jgi:hypothetical protein
MHRTPLTRALSAGLALTDHACHSQPLIEDRAQPSDLGQGINILDLLDFVFRAVNCPVAVCLLALFSTLRIFVGCDTDPPFTVLFLFNFDTLVAVHKKT